MFLVLTAHVLVLFSFSCVGPTGPPPGLGNRNPSGRGYNSGQGPLSPLSKPVSDDDLFAFDG